MLFIVTVAILALSCYYYYYYVVVQSSNEPSRVEIIKLWAMGKCGNNNNDNVIVKKCET